MEQSSGKDAEAPVNIFKTIEGWTCVIVFSLLTPLLVLVTGMIWQGVAERLFSS